MWKASAMRMHRPVVAGPFEGGRRQCAPRCGVPSPRGAWRACVAGSEAGGLPWTAGGRGRVEVSLMAEDPVLARPCAKVASEPILFGRGGHQRTFAALCAKPRSGRQVEGWPDFPSRTWDRPYAETSRRVGDSDVDPGTAEIQRIMQHGGPLDATPAPSWLGTSPPTRAMGAANPLVQDFNWRCNAYHCSHSNLQALREIDARGVSFLRCSSQGGDCRLLVDSPELGLLSAEAEASDHTSYSFHGTPTTRDSCQVSSRQHRTGAITGTPLTCQTGFFVA